MARKSTGTPHWKALAVKLPPEDIDELRRYTDVHRLSLSEVIREGLDLRLHPQQTSNGHTVIPQETATLLLRLAEGLSAAAEDIRSVCGHWAQSALGEGYTVIPEAKAVEESRLAPQDGTAQHDTSHMVIPESVAQPASRKKGGRKLSERGQAILRLLGDHPNGLANAQIKVNLHIDSKTPIHDLLDGMVKRGKLRKDTTGPELRYFVA
jgi:hypothetical protein